MATSDPKMQEVKQEGVVLLLINEAMPGFVRIEFAYDNELPGKIAKLNRTPLPLPYSVYLAARVPDCGRLQRTLQLLFAESCATSRDGFLKINADLVRAVVELAASSLIEFSDEEQGISDEERAESDNARSFRQAQDPIMKRATPDEVLFFKMDKKITCVATGSGELIYEGETLSPTEASLKALQALGFDWNEIYEPAYWLQNLQPAKTDRDGVDIGTNKTPVRRQASADVPKSEDNPIMFIKSG